MNANVDRGALFFGLVLITGGTLLLLDRLGFADFGYVAGHWWPMIIIGIGVSKVLNGLVWNGLWLMTIGLWLQATVMRLFGLTFRSSWPLLLIALGAGIIVRTIVETSRHEA